MVVAWGLSHAIWESILSQLLNFEELFWGYKRLGMRDTVKCNSN
ncbi:unnamed protein product [Linum tenue]|uniref:Uncharacterized protein n=1 Tax=Linum tenue TaxID=586396 RepID=A0AAV0KFG7_9ROSI|nr:unnamed protein product [Linum tenue]